MKRSPGASRGLVRLMQAGLVVILAAGVALGNVSVIVNATLSLAVTALPALLERDHGVTLDPVIVVWITVAVLLHSAGMIGLYDRVWWWDHLTHTLSGGLVAIAGYAVTSAIDEHAPDVTLPPAFLWVFVFLFTVAVGVCWELLEMIGRELARAMDVEPILIVYSVEDTMLDLVFNVVGATIVAAMARLSGGRAVLERLGDSLARQ
ncbi:hypothetical protein [Halapricum desulfuricans]|nr:hypothetical protein [Halapricum desulfuricans]